jgi:hypothetical protein
MPTDYLYTDDMDLRIENGDFVVGDSTMQHQQVLLIAEKGELRQYPLTGVGTMSYLNDDQIGDLYPEIQKQFEADGMVVKTLSIDHEGKINVDAAYKE